MRTVTDQFGVDAVRSGLLRLNRGRKEGRACARKDPAFATCSARSARHTAQFPYVLVVAHRIPSAFLLRLGHKKGKVGAFLWEHDASSPRTLFFIRRSSRSYRPTRAINRRTFRASLAPNPEIPASSENRQPQAEEAVILVGRISSNGFSRYLSRRGERQSAGFDELRHLNPSRRP